jgi:hypothetical protein
MEKIPKVLSSDVLSDELFNDIYDKYMQKAAENPGTGADQATPWIHLADAVSRGTISPLEAFDAIELGYLPENLKVRPSKYYHLL